MAEVGEMGDVDPPVVSVDNPDLSRKGQFLRGAVVVRVARSPRFGSASIAKVAVTRCFPLGQFSIVAFIRGLL